MARSNLNATRHNAAQLSRSVKIPEGSKLYVECFSPAPGWARAHPDQALRMLYICPQDAPWVDEIFS